MEIKGEVQCLPVDGGPLRRNVVPGERSALAAHPRHTPEDESLKSTPKQMFRIHRVND